MSSGTDSDPVQSILRKNGIVDQQPSDLVNATSKIGSQEYNAYCQRFAEQMATGHSGMYASAKAAFQDQAKKGNANSDFSQMQPGDLLYFDDPNQPYGHVGITDGQGNMISATYHGVQKSSINDWLKSTGQRPLGFVRGYK